MHTSHFLGLPIFPLDIAPLFVKIQEILGDDSPCILLQNPLSTHISVYYLPQNLATSDRELIHTKMRDIPENISSFLLKKLEYFGESVAYISLADCTREIEKMFEYFCENLPEFASYGENTHKHFIPHITLFRISEFAVYTKYQEQIEKTVHTFLQSIDGTLNIGDITLYRVWSQFDPELQVAIYS